MGLCGFTAFTFGVSLNWLIIIVFDTIYVQTTVFFCDSCVYYHGRMKSLNWMLWLNVWINYEERVVQ